MENRVRKAQQTPSLPVPRPANDATREKQIPFRDDLPFTHGEGLLLWRQGTGGQLHVEPREG